MGETRDYTTTTFTLGFGGKGKRAEGNNTSSRDTFVFTGISAESTVAAPNSSVHPPRKLPSKAQRQKMAGRGRGRGGFNPGQLKGATWEYDAGAILETKPSELFPPHPNLKKPAPLTAKERREINNYRSLQAKIHRGPLYTQSTKRNADAPTKVFSEEQFNAQYGGNAKADMDPFTGVETYSMRYAPKKNTLPKLSDAPFDKSLFPEELWDTLEGKSGIAVKKHIDRAIQKKAQMMSGKGEDVRRRPRSCLRRSMMRSRVWTMRMTKKRTKYLLIPSSRRTMEVKSIKYVGRLIMFDFCCDLARRWWTGWPLP